MITSAVRAATRYPMDNKPRIGEGVTFVHVLGYKRGQLYDVAYNNSAGLWSWTGDAAMSRVRTKYEAVT